MDPSWLSNAFVLGDRPGGVAVFVDSGAPLAPLLAAVERERLTPTHVLRTHGHPDHVAHEAELTERFGGVTAFLQSPASGAWKEEEEGGTVRDEMLLFEVMVERLDRAWWSGYRAELERRFRQERVVVRALGAEMV